MRAWCCRKPRSSRSSPSLRTEIAGLGALEPLVRREGVTDVLVNAPDEVWVDAGQGLERSEVCFPDEAAVRRLAQRLASSAGRRLDDSVPFIDARLPNGIRLHAILPPVSPQGTCLSLRVPRRQVFTLADLVEVGMIPQAAAPVLEGLVRRRAAFLVSGGTGSGKTTLLNTLLSAADPNDRIVIVEDSAELRPNHPHVVRWNPDPPTLRARVRSRCATSCARLFACARTASWSARFAEVRSSIYWQPSTPVMRAAVERCTRTAPPMCLLDWSRWPCRPG